MRFLATPEHIARHRFSITADPRWPDRTRADLHAEIDAIPTRVPEFTAYTDVRELFALHSDEDPDASKVYGESGIYAVDHYIERTNGMHQVLLSHLHQQLPGALRANTPLAGGWLQDTIIKVLQNPDATLAEFFQAVAVDPIILKSLNADGNTNMGVVQDHANEVLELLTLGIAEGPVSDQDRDELATFFMGYQWKTGFDERLAFEGDKVFRGQKYRDWNELAKALAGMERVIRHNYTNRLMRQFGFVDADLLNAIIKTAQDTGGHLRAIEHVIVDHPSSWSPECRQRLTTPQRCQKAIAWSGLSRRLLHPWDLNFPGMHFTYATPFGAFETPELRDSTAQVMQSERTINQLERAFGEPVEGVGDMVRSLMSFEDGEQEIIARAVEAELPDRQLLFLVKHSALGWV
ncbi:MAG: DUF1800 family protein [Pseudomonadota bacterium]